MSLLKFPLMVVAVISLLLSVIIPRNVQAFEVREYHAKLGNQKLQKIFDRYHYAIAVVWDQIDQDFKQNADETLSAALVASGLNGNEIQSYLEHYLLGQNSEDYGHFVSALKKTDLSTEEISDLTRNFLNHRYAQGVSFNGEGAVHGGYWKTGVIVLLVVIATVVIVGQLHEGGRDRGDNCREDCTIVIIN